MKHSLACPKCGTRFQVELPEVVRVAMCPACGTPIPVAADELGSLNMNVREAVHREGTWILWAAGAFALIWGLIVAVMIIVNHHSTPPVATGTPPPAPVTPAPTTPPPTPVPTPPAVTTPPPAPVVVAPPPDTQPEIVHTPPPEIRLVPQRTALTDAEIVAAIEKGITYLLTTFQDGELKSTLGDNPVHHQGMDALAVYTLLHCSQSIHDQRITVNNPAMRRMIDRLKRFQVAPMLTLGPVTYVHSLRASALALYNRQEDRDQLYSDFGWLIHASFEGAYAYDDDFYPKGVSDAERANIQKRFPFPMHTPIEFSWDNSNCQYGLLGVWNCAEAGVEVPGNYWQAVERHWIDSQLPDGTWPYTQGQQGRFSMTVAGITALSVCRDFMETAAVAKAPTSNPYAKANAQALDRAIAWLETGDNSIGVNGENYGYSLYGLERAALSAGMMFAGTHDIYRELAKEVVHKQADNGSWGNITSDNDQVIQTSFALLFLARGRNPVIMNKLRYAGDWANHPRDCANLARFASYSMERPVNWQTVTLHQPWWQWMESPILYISGDAPLEMGPADYERLQKYADNGGLIITHSDNGSPAFTAFAKDLAAKLFPKYEMVDVPDNDDLYSLQFKIPAPHPHFRTVSNGSRRMMLHCSDDIAGVWQINNSKRDKAAFELGINLIQYANGRSELHTKTDSPYIIPPTDVPQRKVAVARVQYAGNWDPEPAAWTRFSRYFAWETGWSLVPQETPAAEVDYSKTDFAYLTGTAPDRPTDQQAAALKKFVNDGGTLFIEAAGGSKLFDEAAKKYWIPAIIPNPLPQAIKPEHPILSGKIDGVEIAATALPRLLLRPYSSQVVHPLNTSLMEIPGGKGRIILSDLDLTTGLLGTNIWGINGYAPEYTQAILKNVILQTEVTKGQTP